MIFVALAQFVLAGCNGVDNGFIEAHRGDAMPHGDGGKQGSSDAGPQGDGGLQADGGELDAAIDLDGATMDAAVLGIDGGLDLPMGTLITADGKTIILPDGEVIDLDTAIMRYKPEVDVTTCEIADEDTWEHQVADFSEGSFSLVPGPVGFAFAYRSSDGMNNVASMAIPGSAGFPEPQPVFPVTQSNIIGDLALLNRNSVCPLSAPLCDDARVQFAWVDNFTGTDEVHTAALSADLQRMVEARVQVNAEDDTTESEAKPALAEVDGRVVAAWITRGGPDGDVISTRVLGGDTDITDVVGADFKQKPLSLSMATLGPETIGLAWVSAEGEEPGFWLQRLDKDGLALDAPVKLSSFVGAGSSISIASHADGGGILYGIQIDDVKQVRYRNLGPAGELLDSEKTIVGSDFLSTAPSLYALGSGFAVVYRALPGRGGIEEPQVRITFIPKYGTIPTDKAGHLLSSKIATCNVESDSRTTVAVSIEGEVMVAWADTDAPSSSNKLLRLVRRRLACGQ